MRPTRRHVAALVVAVAAVICLVFAALLYLLYAPDSLTISLPPEPSSAASLPVNVEFLLSLSLSFYLLCVAILFSLVFCACALCLVLPSLSTFAFSTRPKSRAYTSALVVEF